MPLYIRDDDVAELARRVQRVTHAKTLADAVRVALLHELERVDVMLSLRERLSNAMAIADAMGPSDPDFDQKAFMDKMWGQD